MKTATVVIPHAFTTRWTQIAVASLRRFQNDATFDILVVDNSIPHHSIRGITETALGAGVTVTPPQDPARGGHQLALDYAIGLVETPWFVAWETDTVAHRDGWLDWMLSFVKDDFVAMAGWYWSIGIDDSRHYISPAGALYRTSILKMLKEECLRNKDLAVCYGRDMSKRINLASEYPHTAGRFIPEGNWGPFSECRGFGNVYPFPIDHWVPEPGNWIYNRCSMQWECVRLPGDFVVNETVRENGIQQKHTYIGPSDAEAYYRHYWAGTVSHNFDKHQIPKHDQPKLRWWLNREYALWNEIVPEEVRRQTIDAGLVRTFDEEYSYALSRVVA